MQKGTIVIEVDPITPIETEAYRQKILTLIANGIFNIKNGKAELHFDAEGTLQQIVINVVKYRRRSQ